MHLRANTSFVNVGSILFLDSTLFVLQYFFFYVVPIKCILYIHPRCFAVLSAHPKTGKEATKAAAYTSSDNTRVSVSAKEKKCSFRRLPGKEKSDPLLLSPSHKQAHPLWGRVCAIMKKELSCNICRLISACSHDYL